MTTRAFVSSINNYLLDYSNIGSYTVAVSWTADKFDNGLCVQVYPKWACFKFWQPLSFHQFRLNYSVVAFGLPRKNNVCYVQFNNSTEEQSSGMWSRKAWLAEQNSNALAIITTACPNTKSSQKHQQIESSPWLVRSILVSLSAALATSLTNISSKWCSADV